jgi:predicted branched-subunit amino acid permease
MSGAAPFNDPAILPETAEDLGGRSRSAWFMEGARQAMAGPMLVVAVSLLSVGGLARDAGFSVEVAVASTILLWAGPAQVLFFGAVAAKTSWPVIALTISLSSVRFVPMVVSLLPMLRTRRTSLPTLLLAAHCIAVTVWAEGMRRIPLVPRDGRLAFFFGFSLICFVGTSISTALGFVLIGELPPPFAAGLLFMTPIYFVATLTRNAKRPIDRWALILGLAVAPLTEAFAPRGLDLMVLGLSAGTGAWLIQRHLDGRAGA